MPCVSQQEEEEEEEQEEQEEEALAEQETHKEMTELRVEGGEQTLG